MLLPVDDVAIADEIGVQVKDRKQPPVFALPRFKCFVNASIGIGIGVGIEIGMSGGEPITNKLRTNPK